MKIIPVGKKVLIKEQKLEKYPNSNIFIPDSMQKSTYKGHVVAVGKDVKEVSIGDLIQYADYAVPNEMEHNGEKHLLINEGDIFAIISV